MVAFIKLSNSACGGPDLYVCRQICREAGFRKCISPAENLEFGKRLVGDRGKKWPAAKRGSPAGWKTNMALISAT